MRRPTAHWRPALPVTRAFVRRPAPLCDFAAASRSHAVHAPGRLALGQRHGRRPSAASAAGGCCNGGHRGVGRPASAASPAARSFESQAFVARGGVVLVDADSESSTTPAMLPGVPITPTGMHVCAYTTETNTDMTGALIARNAGNSAALAGALLAAGAARPVVTSASPELWAIPTTSGDVTYCACGCEKRRQRSPIPSRCFRRDRYQHEQHHH